MRFWCWRSSTLTWCGWVNGQALMLAHNRGIQLQSDIRMKSTSEHVSAVLCHVQMLMTEEDLWNTWRWEYDIFPPCFRWGQMLVLCHPGNHGLHFYFILGSKPSVRWIKRSFMSWTSTVTWQHSSPRRRSTPPSSTRWRWSACVWAAPWTPCSVFLYSWSSFAPRRSSDTLASCSSHTSSCVTTSRYSTKYS